MAQLAWRCSPWTVWSLIGWLGLYFCLGPLPWAWADGQRVAKNPTAKALFLEGFNSAHGRKQDLARAVQCYEEAARLGYAPAQYNLARMYLLGNGVKENAELARLYFAKAAEQGLLLAQYNLAVLLETGQGGEIDEAQAFNWYAKAAEQGDVEATYRLGLMLEEGRGVKADLEEALRSYEVAARKGHARAQNNAGVLYEKQGAKLWPMAVYWYHKAAMQGHALAQYNLSECYAKGRGVAKNERAAKMWREKASSHAEALEREFISEQQKDFSAQNSKVLERDLPGPRMQGPLLSQRRLAGEAKEQGFSKNLEVRFREFEGKRLPRLRSDAQLEAPGLLRRPMERGASLLQDKEPSKPLTTASKDKPSTWQISPLSTKNRERAEKLYREAQSYEEKGEKQWPKAEQLYREAAALKYAPAAYKLGCVLDEQEAGEEEQRKAWVWFRDAANGGHAKAMYRLGRMFELGRGTPKNLPLALFWYAQAKAKGEDKAKDALVRLGQ